ncbi:hypothetical protein G6F51_014556 [Rhizopus arrhizus]|uniref:Methyltransferase type 11 domain-containing protein n=1 Tax=Rhizopus oryzae TaxID=64495 RepID=A0A9P6XLM5_RHIOR|nr:hypothetical protein G6F51_014556 [Rhizopus arrhizus]
MKEESPECAYDGFDIGNVVQGLSYADNTFDFVDIRFLVLALREDQWPMTIKELARVTKPGGMIQMTELDINPLDTDCQPFHVVTIGR